nr:MAG TPA: hypothetical protein [Caudoviricetes sp.]
MQVPRAKTYPLRARGQGLMVSVQACLWKPYVF